MTPTTSVDTVDTARATSRGWRDDRGMSTLEAILTIPVLVGMFLAVVQVAMWWYARQLASTAAQEASRTARAYASTASAGHDRGEEYLTLQQANGHALTDVQVHVRRSATTVTVTVTGYTVSLIPYMKLRVSEISSGPVERYVPVSRGFRNSEGASAANRSTGGG